MKGSSGGGVGRVGGGGEVQQELLKDQLLQRAQWGQNWQIVVITLTFQKNSNFNFLNIFQAKSGKEFRVVNEAWSGRKIFCCCRMYTLADNSFEFEIWFSGFLFLGFIWGSEKHLLAGVKHPGGHIKFSLLGDYNQVLYPWCVLMCVETICTVWAMPERKRFWAGLP